MGSATTTAIVLVSILLFFSAAGLAYEVIVLVRSGATNSWRMYVKLTPYILTVFFQLMAISEFSMRNKYLICPYVTGTVSEKRFLTPEPCLDHHNRLLHRCWHHHRLQLQQIR
ncbi:hypothetical protein L596_023666 [Steinernema carpocapsae]|uniref:Uncharacterized protein n=1 Tax=Steinernema carpocapsae TaxID=34508 RepID=A0A4U5MEJ7_STECR|nr:hypothetical protein L596_023666 [Steinernema carpocapsae]